LAHIVFDRSKFKPLISSSIPYVVISPTSSPKYVVSSLKASMPGHASIPTQNPPRFMAARFPPLVFLAQLHDFPQNYSKRIKTYGA